MPSASQSASDTQQTAGFCFVQAAAIASATTTIIFSNLITTSEES
jgi:hypothetical protein